MKRVLIIGSPGAGKTTFARKLADKTGLSLVHLDYYYHQKKFDYYNDRAAWRKRVKGMITKDQWIIDGNYGDTFDIRFARADLIIFMECSRTKAVYRVLKRHITQHGKRRTEMPPEWEEKFERGFLKYVWCFNKKELPKMYEELKNHKKKAVVILKSSKQTQKYLELL